MPEQPEEVVDAEANTHIVHIRTTRTMSTGHALKLASESETSLAESDILAQLLI